MPPPPKKKKKRSLKGETGITTKEMVERGVLVDTIKAQSLERMRGGGGIVAFMMGGVLAQGGTIPLPPPRALSRSKGGGGVGCRARDLDDESPSPALNGQPGKVTCLESRVAEK